MKTLEELGISPSPWKTADDGMGYKDIWCNATVTEDSEGENIIAEAISKKDANMMAASPEMYEALAAMLSCAEKEAPFTTGSGMSIAMDMARKALRKAAGESEVTE